MCFDISAVKEKLQIYVNNFNLLVRVGSAPEFLFKPLRQKIAALVRS